MRCKNCNKEVDVIRKLACFICSQCRHILKYVEIDMEADDE